MGHVATYGSSASNGVNLYYGIKKIGFLKSRLGMLHLLRILRLHVRINDDVVNPSHRMRPIVADLKLSNNTTLKVRNMRSSLNQFRHKYADIFRKTSYFKHRCKKTFQKKIYKNVKNVKKRDKKKRL